MKNQAPKNLKQHKKASFQKNWKQHEELQEARF